jgi:CheY-like chemotaxis protein
MGRRLQGHVLIIEDEMLIAMDIEHMLEDLGFDSFDIADSPSQALAKAKAQTPDLITADVRIVGGTGIEAVSAIHDALGPIPTVYVTGNLDVVREQHAPAVVEKPISPQSFAAACEWVLSAEMHAPLTGSC